MQCVTVTTRVVRMIRRAQKPLRIDIQMTFKRSTDRSHLCYKAPDKSSGALVCFVALF
ncbi:MAG: hypothetical protein H6Q76_105 [Firmicutes bacterium]|nr:hypothetical protein [Bacillota bacterium]